MGPQGGTYPSDCRRILWYDFWDRLVHDVGKRCRTLCFPSSSFLSFFAILHLHATAPRNSTILFTRITSKIYILIFECNCFMWCICPRPPRPAPAAQARAWETVFYVYGLVGLIWVFCAWIYLKSSPAEDLAVSSTELAIICNTDHGNSGGGGGSGRSSSSSGISINIGSSKSSAAGSGSSASPAASSGTEPTLYQLLTHPAFIGISAAHFAHNWGWYVCSTNASTRRRACS